MKRLAAEQNVKPAVQHKEDKSYITAKTPKILAFDDSKDEMDSYLLRFERYATALSLSRSLSLSGVENCAPINALSLLYLIN